MAIPNKNLGLAMSPKEFTVALHVWLGIPVFPVLPQSARCSCGTVIDLHSDHVGCGNVSLRNKRHNALCDIIFHIALVDNYCKHEQRCSSHNNTRPGDVYHPDFLQDRVAYFILMVRNSLQPLYINFTANEAGAAATAGQYEKIARYDDKITSTGSDFYPLVVETLGTWSAASKDIGKKNSPDHRHYYF